MEQEEIDQIKNEVLRKIGRNMMLFQQLEHMLKHLVITAEQTLFLKEKKTNVEQREQDFHKKTMGTLVGKYLNDYFTSIDKKGNKTNEISDNSFSFKFGVECDNEYHGERTKTLSLLVDERNDLIHHLLPKWNMGSPESSAEVGCYLDEQREKILPEIEFFKEQIKNRDHVRKQLVEYLQSDKATQDLFPTVPLKQTKIVARLWNIAKNSSNSDGWVLLSTAANNIYIEAPQEFIYVKERYGFKKLKEVLFATEEYFDVTEEITDKGGKHMLYRIKPDLTLPGD